MQTWQVFGVSVRGPAEELSGKKPSTSAVLFYGLNANKQVELLDSLTEGGWMGYPILPTVSIAFLYGISIMIAKW